MHKKKRGKRRWKKTLVWWKLPKTSKCCYLLLLQPHHSLNTTSILDKKSFAVSYLTNNCALSPQDAFKASKRLRFNTPDKPNSFISFFKTHGFPNHQIQIIIRKIPSLIVYNPIKTILPKFQFLASKGASPQDIVATVTRSPNFLCSSLENNIIPSSQLVRSFCPSDHKAITSIIICPSSITDSRFKPNVQFLLDFGLTRSSIYRLLTSRPSTICCTDLKKALEEIKELGFQPSKYNFCVALLAKRAVTKSQWDAKVDVLKSWGCCEDAIFNAFRKQPNFMLRSPDKLNAVMRFWVDELGWDTLLLLTKPAIFGYSIEKRLIPRASIIKHLLSKGLMKEGASLCTPFYLTDENFQRRHMWNALRRNHLS